ncbi:hypothetical protein HK096_008685 [Nowakowskiella sp. JEL0078]|nr:hypothetical protein HK096_008685 [Nowakowskiella sp. JEL0078]
MTIAISGASGGLSQQILVLFYKKQPTTPIVALHAIHQRSRQALRFKSLTMMEKPSHKYLHSLGVKQHTAVIEAAKSASVHAILYTSAPDYKETKEVVEILPVNSYYSLSILTS